VTSGLVFFVAGGVWAGLAAFAGRVPREPAQPPGWVRAVALVAVAASWAWLVLDGR
jgi:hypothetical protein